MKIVRIAVSIVGTLFFAGCMFFCFVAGAPQEKAELAGYVWKAAGFSLLFAAFNCACINYILYLQKKIEKLENER